jgi:hypothetical protein
MGALECVLGSGVPAPFRIGQAKANAPHGPKAPPCANRGAGPPSSPWPDWIFKASAASPTTCGSDSCSSFPPCGEGPGGRTPRRRGTAPRLPGHGPWRGSQPGGDLAPRKDFQLPARQPSGPTPHGGTAATPATHSTRPRVRRSHRPLPTNGDHLPRIPGPPVEREKAPFGAFFMDAMQPRGSFRGPS